MQENTQNEPFLINSLRVRALATAYISVDPAGFFYN